MDDHLGPRELIMILNEMISLTPCADCPSTPTLLTSGEDAGEVVLMHQPTCPAVKARTT